MKKNKGFVTLAVGNERYYQLAVNLLRSYKYFAKNKLMPFAIVADRKNKYTALFDDVIILQNPSKSYMDKLQILQMPPYNENIFIDADCLAYGNLNNYWLYLSNLGGVRCFGSSHPLSFDNGWFKISDIGHYKDRISYIPKMHGGIIYFRDDELTKCIIKDALDIAKNYNKYRFMYFDKPADEPILALASTVNNCRPIELDHNLQKKMFCFLPACNDIKYDISKGYLSYLDNKQRINNVLLLHWQNCNTEKTIYYKEVLKLSNMPIIIGKFKILNHFIHYHLYRLINKVNSKIDKIFNL